MSISPKIIYKQGLKDTNCILEYVNSVFCVKNPYDIASELNLKIPEFIALCKCIGFFDYDKTKESPELLDTIKSKRNDGVGFRDIATELNIPLYHVMKLYFENFATRKRWADWECRLVLEYYTQIKTGDLLKLLLGKDAVAINSKYKRLIGDDDMKWSSEDITYLLDNYGKIKASDIAKKLGRSENSVIKFHYKYTLKNKPSYDFDLIVRETEAGKSLKAIYKEYYSDTNMSKFFEFCDKNFG